MNEVKKVFVSLQSASNKRDGKLDTGAKAAATLTRAPVKKKTPSWARFASVGLSKVGSIAKSATQVAKSKVQKVKNTVQQAKTKIIQSSMGLTGEPFI